MTEAELEASVALLKSQGIVDSGEAIAGGIGAMNAARIREFYGKVAAAGLYRPGEVDLDKVAVFDFVNKGVGLDVKRKLLGN
jgi:NitT/TauT family transport system substrate-binding protein